jgi:hypothetical protein
MECGGTGRQWAGSDPAKPDQPPRARLFMPARDMGYAGLLLSGAGIQTLPFTLE